MFEDRQFQSDAVAAVFRFWMSELGNGNPIVVAPTGSGKSFIIARLIMESRKMSESVRIVVLADVKELIEQNAAAYFDASGDTEYGIYSASVGVKDILNPVTFAQIQSVHKIAHLFGHIDFCIVDEAHMVNVKNAGMYRAFFDALSLRNENLKVVGFTATPYRLGSGYVYKNKDALFSGVAYEISILKLIELGFLVRPVARSGKVVADTNRIERSSNGEFKEDSATIEFGRITSAAVDDMMNRLQDRKSIIVFACSIAHAEGVRAEIAARGERAIDLVTGKTPKMEREEIIDRVRSGQTRWIVNVGVLTKGFDAKNIDSVVLLRATESAALYVQMVGRGLRPYPGKTECVVLDYGRNVLRHGPINDVTPKKKGERRNESVVMAKECPNCHELIALGARVCPSCLFELPLYDFDPDIDTAPSDLEIIGTAAVDSKVAWRDVLDMRVVRHDKHVTNETVRSSLKISYRVSFADWVNEFVSPESSPYAADMAKAWFEARGFGFMKVDQALECTFPTPQRILVDSHGKYPAVKDVFFGANLLR